MRLLLVVVAAMALLWAGAAVAAGAKAPARASAKPCSAVKKEFARKRCRRSRASLRYVAGRGVARGVAAGPAGALGWDSSSGPGAGGVGVVAADPGADGDPRTAAPVVASTLGVEARDVNGFVLRLTRTAVAAGNLTIFFRNHDSSRHNLWIEPPAGASALISDDVGEGAGATKTVPVTPGSWRLFCAIDGHSAMTRELAVL